MTLKNALVFAASGAIAQGVARALAAEGFRVHLSARRLEAIVPLKTEIEAAGGTATVALVDATDEAAVEVYVDGVVQVHGSLDVVFNGIGGRPAELAYPRRLRDLPLADFLLPIERIVGSQFLTSKVAGLKMAEQPTGGAILLLTATLSNSAFAHMTGIITAMTAIEGLGRALSADFGPSGVRVNVIRGSAMPETRTIQETFAGHQALEDSKTKGTRSLTVADIASVVAFTAGRSATNLSGQIITVATGALA